MSSSSNTRSKTNKSEKNKHIDDLMMELDKKMEKMFGPNQFTIDGEWDSVSFCNENGDMSFRATSSKGTVVAMLSNPKTFKLGKTVKSKSSRDDVNVNKKKATGKHKKKYLSSSSYSSSSDSDDSEEVTRGNGGAIRQFSRNGKIYQEISGIKEATMPRISRKKNKCEMSIDEATLANGVYVKGLTMSTYTKKR